MKLEKQKTRDGAEFWVRAEGDETETNFVLAEKLRLESGVDLPKYAGGSIEDYLKEVAAAGPATLTWKVRRQMVVGIFPSAKMAMYQDLDTSRRDFEGNEVISSLFGGSGAGGATPFADEHDTDDPAVEAKAPYLVLDADSSQFSTIVDVSDGKNLAVEGPPGTGKSQTIVNTIANALAQGNKVLFVAEKMAALEVVKARLEAVGLGEFLLPLQAERSSREQVIQSVRARLEMEYTGDPRDYEDRLEKFRQTRSELANYVEVISRSFGSTGLKAYDVLGKGIATNDVLKDAPRKLQTPSIPNVEALTAVQIETALEKAKALADAWQATGDVETFWDQVECVPIDRFTTMELSRLAQDASEAYSKVHHARGKLTDFGFKPDTEVETLAAANAAAKALIPLADQVDASFLRSIVTTGSGERARQFLAACKKAQETERALSGIVTAPRNLAVPRQLRTAAALCKQHGFTSLVPRLLEDQLRTARSELRRLEDAYGSLKGFVDYFPAAASIPVNVLAKAGEISRSTDSSALSIRSELIAGAGGVALLDQLCDTGRRLQSERERLSAVISTSTELSSTELRAHADALRSAGPLGFLSGAVKAAKRAYQGLFSGGAFEKEAAIYALSSLAKWKEAAHRFGEDVQARTVFGLHFKGVDTDFYLFELLSAYYARVDAAFAGPAHREIRALLKTGDLDLITSIPEISVGNQTATFEALGNAIAQQHAELDSRSNAIQTLAALLSSLREPDKLAPDQLDVLASELEEATAAATRLGDDTQLADLLGSRFAGWETDTKAFEADLLALELIEKDQTLRETLLLLLERGSLHSAGECLSGAIELDRQAWQTLHALGEKAGSAIVEAVEGRSLQDAAEYLAAAANDTEGMTVHSRFQTACNEIDELGYGWVVDELEDNELPLSELPRMLEAVIFRAMAVRLYDMHGSIFGRYPGVKLDELRATLARLDREIIKLSRKQLRSRLSRAARPPQGNSIGKKSDLTELALLSHEITKKTKHAPVRDLTRRAGRALLELKPCWMMSPLAVAQYLPSTVMFDLCIIDEASQMPPEDAVGALYRSRQAMVVGDTN